MADIDRISSLPNEILCHILSFLPTEVSVLTSVLSKRWNPLWISVPTFHFDIHDDNYFCDNNKEAYSLFIQSVYSFLLWRDFEKPLQTFRLRYCTIFYDYSNIKTWLHFATTQGRVQHLDLYFDGFIHLPSFVLGCKTLVVLKLKKLLLKDLSSVDLPNLKVLHLNSVVLADGVAVAHLLSGCPNLEDLELKSLVFRTIGKFQRLPKLVRANIHTHLVPLEVLNNVQFLSMSWIEDKDVLPEFPNLTHIEIGYLVFTKDWIEVLKVLQNSPILQILVIEKHNAKIPIEEESEVWPYPESVPLCILSHLRTCCLKNFGEGFKGEFQFARYILQNAKHLRRMRISFDDEASQEERVKMINQLSLCARRSETCTLSFA